MDLSLFNNADDLRMRMRLSNAAIYIDPRAWIAEDAILMPGVSIFGPVVITSAVKILPNAIICGNALIGTDSVVLPHAIISNVRTGASCTIGGHLTDVSMGARCRTGPLSEMTRCVLGNDIACIHHSFLGDAFVEDAVNIGAGVITSNFDGERKKKTFIGYGSFIGINVNLIARDPELHIGKNSFIAAGVTIRQDIPDNSFVKPVHTNGEDIKILPNLKQITSNNRWHRISTHHED